MLFVLLPEIKEDPSQEGSRNRPRSIFSIWSHRRFTDLSALENIDTLQVSKDIFLEADQIEFGADLDEITQIVDVPEHEQRFGIDTQTNDMLNEILSHIPNAKRDSSVLNSIHQLIERYKQLRESFSNFDQNNNALLPKCKRSCI